MSNEKAPLIQRFDASDARAEPAPRPRCSSKKTALKVIGATAAAGILYYGVPEGELSHGNNRRAALIDLCSRSAV